MEFLGRERELKLLRNELTAARPSLVILFGRRRIGKSRFLRELGKGHDEIYFQATRVSSLLNLEQFKAEVGKTIGSKPQLNALSNWEGVLHYVAEHTAEHPGLIVTIDEFPYLLDDEPALPSILQKFWDSGAPDQGAMKLILCGSAISQMEEMLAERNPLYGRKTLSLDMKPLPLSDVAKFFPEYDADDIIKAYAIFGGIPYYLQLCNPSASLRENVVNLLLTETGTLIDEPNTLLQTELREPTFYSSILAAVSDGCNSKSEIANRLGVKADNIGPYMAKLRALDLISNPKSLDADEKGRNRRYRVADSLISFWHRFVRPNLTAISSGFGGDVYDRVVEPQFSEYMGIEFEGIALEYAKLHIQEILGVPAQEVGQIWGHADFDIDVAGRLLNGAFFFGECKWRTSTIDLGHVRLLRQRSEKTTYGKSAADKHFLFFSRIGFSSDVIDLAKEEKQLHLLTPENLVNPRR
ncbi:ATP-binding protein [Pararhizobium sp. LjRoot238]|uniref:ATP-binding protein n=1 Tax=Pararhizobium sp. LjRoot238 TaxID=3342293 RepID=UPI003ECFE8AD